MIPSRAASAGGPDHHDCRIQAGRKGNDGQRDHELHRLRRDCTQELPDYDERAGIQCAAY